VLAAARTGIGHRVLVVFQPHRYSRTRQLVTEFGRALAQADEVVLTDIYPAGEDPIPGVTAERVAEAIRAHADVPVHVVRPFDALAPAVTRLARPADIVITLGAGSIGTVGERILCELRLAHRKATTDAGPARND
jgi:UDP-N-acetylmuramate--alanine ligase